MVLQHPLKAWCVHVCAQGHTCLHTHEEAIGQPQMSPLGILLTSLCSLIGLGRASPRDHPPPLSHCTRGGEKARHKGDCCSVKPGVWMPAHTLYSLQIPLAPTQGGLTSTNMHMHIHMYMYVHTPTNTCTHG